MTCRVDKLDDSTTYKANYDRNTSFFENTKN